MSDRLSTEEERRLREALEQFEQCLATPLVPGELERWVEAVAKAFLELKLRLRRQIEQNHPPQYAEIAAEDPGLLARIRQMRDQDRSLLGTLDALEKTIGELSHRAPDVEPDEARLDRRIAEFVDHGMRFVILIRRQETALATWLQEAFHRERGDVD